jgi:hypothetical protein
MLELLKQLLIHCIPNYYSAPLESYKGYRFQVNITPDVTGSSGIVPIFSVDSLRTDIRGAPMPNLPFTTTSPIRLDLR